MIAERSEELKARASEYNALYLERERKKAKEFITEEDREKFFVQIYKFYRENTVTDSEIEEVSVKDDALTGTVVVKRRIYQLTSNTIRNERIEQEWKYIKKKWYLTKNY